MPVDHDDFSVAARPIFHDGIVYFITGFTHPELWAIRLGPTGNLTESDAVLWRQKSGVSKTASPLFVDGLIYMVSDDGIINCFDVANGERVWQKRIGGGVRGVAYLRRRPNLLLRPGRRVHRHRTRPQVQRVDRQHAGRRLHGVADRRRRCAYSSH